MANTMYARGTSHVAAAARYAQRSAATGLALAYCAVGSIFDVDADSASAIVGAGADGATAYSRSQLGQGGAKVFGPLAAAARAAAAAEAAAAAGDEDLACELDAERQECEEASAAGRKSKSEDSARAGACRAVPAQQRRLLRPPYCARARPPLDLCPHALFPRPHARTRAH